MCRAGSEGGERGYRFEGHNEKKDGIFRHGLIINLLVCLLMLYHIFLPQILSRPGCGGSCLNCIVFVFLKVNFMLYLGC